MKNIEKYWPFLIVVYAISVFTKPAFCFLLLGFLFLFMGIKAIVFLNTMNKSGIEAKGKIVEFETDKQGDLTPLLEYINENGDLIRSKPTVQSSTNLDLLFAKFSLGDELVIKYEKQKNENFIIVEDSNFNSIVFFVFGLIGLVLFSIGVLSLFNLIQL